MEMRLCSEEGCDATILARGLCGKHYQKEWRAKNPGYFKRYYTPVQKDSARICEQCGGQFVPWRRDQRFCGWDCGHRFHRRKSDQPWNDRRRANYHRRRALKKAAAIGDPVLLSKIRERDGNRCGLCGKRVNGNSYPHPLSASLDHMVPLSEGGAHDPTNVQLAHLQCNLRKGVRGGGEQLRIV